MTPRKMIQETSGAGAGGKGGQKGAIETLVDIDKQESRL